MPSPFLIRYGLYSTLDRQLNGYTRFFGAAAMTNAVLAHCPRLQSPIERTCYPFLNNLGKELQTANLRFAAAISLDTLMGPALDRHLICNEQRLVQTYIASRQSLAGGHWERIRRNLNDLLNERSALSVMARCFARSREYYSVLRHIREEVGVLDFANESHRVRIGLGLTRHLRRQPNGIGREPPAKY